MNNLQPHQQRVVEEREDLEERLMKLKVFLTSDVFQTLDDTNKDLLETQAVVMGHYLTILTARIALF